MILCECVCLHVSLCVCIEECVCVSTCLSVCIAHVCDKSKIAALLNFFT